jgi:hypothetical protein
MQKMARSAPVGKASPFMKPVAGSISSTGPRYLFKTSGTSVEACNCNSSATYRAVGGWQHFRKVALTVAWVLPFRSKIVAAHPAMMSSRVAASMSSTARWAGVRSLNFGEIALT